MLSGLKGLCELMGRNEMKTIPIAVSCLCLGLLLLSGCPNPASLAQFGIMTGGQIASGFDQGIAAQPYLVYSETSLEEINEVCRVDPGIRISLEVMEKLPSMLAWKIPTNRHTGKIWRTYCPAVIRARHSGT